MHRNLTLRFAIVILGGVVAIRSAGLAQIDPPANDDFANAAPLTGASGLASGSNQGASAEAAEPRHSDLTAQKTAWWSWRPDVDGTAIVYSFGSNFDTVLAAYTGEVLGALEPVASNDDWGGSTISLIEFDVARNTTYHIAVDGFDGAQGAIQLIYHVDPFVPTPPDHDDFEARRVVEGLSGRDFASNRAASRQVGEPLGGDASLWWTWQAPESGLVFVSTSGTSFRALLGVFRGSSLDTLEEAPAFEGADGTVADRRVVSVEAGRWYHVAVASAGASTGLALIDWQFLDGCFPPEAPAGPQPPDEGELAGTSVLRWHARKTFERRVIYGEDDRLEAYEIEDPRVAEVLAGTVALIDRSALRRQENGSYVLQSGLFGPSEGICDSERFVDQPNPAFCSGFLVAEDLIVTAGHCVVDQEDCGSTALVFGFQMLDAQTPALVFPPEQVYFCAGIVARKEIGDNDWALLRLQRPVQGRSPLRLRREGRVADGQPLVVVGHPSGLPVKVAGGARVRGNSEDAYFVANLDTYGGNSGSPVLDVDTLEVEGLLVSGEDDFVRQGDCWVSNRCPDDGCLGESCTRVSEFAALIPPHPETVLHDVYLGREGELSLAGSVRLREIDVGTLEPETSYSWQVVSRDECGETHGPVWTFRTTEEVGASFRRGEIAVDGDVDITDALVLLGHLFLGETLDFDCEASLDIDDNDEVEITDVVVLLGHLFLGSETPAPPYPACGTDPTPGRLGCVEHTACP